MKQAIKGAVAEKNLLPAQPKTSKRHMRENRATEKASFRGAGLNGALPVSPAATASPPVEAPSTAQASSSGGVPSTPAESTGATKFKSLWSKVSAVNK